MKGFRKELKYLISYEDYLVIKSVLQRVFKMDSNTQTEEGGYHIRSLYFDDIHDSALFEKNYGLHTRKKFRIRIYNKSNEIIRLEKKMKMGDYNLKSKYDMSVENYEDIMNGNFGFVRDINSPVFYEFYSECKAKGLKPKIIVDYFRESYVFGPANVRITFDKELRVGRGVLNIFEDIATHSIFKSGKIIFEIKFDEFLPEIVKLAIGYMDGMPLSISKYVLCREFFEKL